MPTDIRLEFVYPPGYRVAVIDGAVVAVQSDGVGDTIGLTPFRTETISISQPAVVLDNGQIQIAGGVTPESKVVRTMEFQALMRPDKARDLFVALRDALKKLPAARRDTYGITNEQLGLPEGAP